MSIYKKFMVAAMTIIVFAAALAFVIPRLARDAGVEAAEGFVEGVSENASDGARSVGAVIDSVFTDAMIDSTNAKMQELAGGIGGALKALRDSIRE